jgi:hypothetical protein
MVTASALIGGQPYSWVVGKHNLPAICDFPADGRPRRGLGSRADVMVIFRPIGHLAAWLVWHSTGVSLYEDLDAPRPPATTT